MAPTEKADDESSLLELDVVRNEGDRAPVVNTSCTRKLVYYCFVDRKYMRETRKDR